MRKLTALLAAAAMVACFSSTALAAKPKKVNESFGATLAPFPNYSSNTSTARPGCTAGEEGIHWVGQDFTSPGKGTLSFHAEGFTGDWDLYVFEQGTDLVYARSDQEQAGPAMAPAEEHIDFPMTKGQTITLVVCNWAGDPNVQATYEGTFR